MRIISYQSNQKIYESLLMREKINECELIDERFGEVRELLLLEEEFFDYLC